MVSHPCLSGVQVRRCSLGNWRAVLVNSCGLEETIRHCLNSASVMKETWTVYDHDSFTEGGGGTTKLLIACHFKTVLLSWSFSKTFIIISYSIIVLYSLWLPTLSIFITSPSMKSRFVCVILSARRKNVKSIKSFWMNSVRPVSAYQLKCHRTWNSQYWISLRSWSLCF